MTLPIATRLGPYEIVAPLGAGGMGEVYRAKDTRLGRDVAVKVLLQHRSGSAEVRSRFEREARTVSSLNHPHICTLHDVGREGDTDYLVMELVEGETLAQRLTRGPLPTSEVLKLGPQIADALDRAHRAGVVHRDLKPGNVMLTRSGAKLMDFGLARATGLQGTSSSGISIAMTQSPTIAQPLTAEGTIVGTFQYMSPEQLEGKEADARSDLWALGCVLYEMVTGKRAFEGGTQASLISAIMRDEPRPITQLAPMSPPGLERLILQCMAKDPEDRWQSAGDVRRELEWIRSSTSQSGASVPAPGVRRAARVPAWIWPALGAALALVAALAVFGPWSRHAEAPRLMRFTIGSPTGAVLGAPAEAELAPDGRAFAFVAVDSVGTSRVYLRPLDSADARALAGTEGGALPFWSPDGRWIGFFANAKLKKVALDGSAPVVLCDAPDARGGAWSPGGTIVFAPNNQGGLFRVTAGGGVATALTHPDPARQERGHRYPQFLPDGEHFLYVAIGTDQRVTTTFASSLRGGQPVEVCRGGSMGRFAPPDHLLLLESGTGTQARPVYARRFDPGRRTATGEARLVLDRVSATNFGYPNLTADPRGTLVIQHWSDPHARLAWVDRSGHELGVAAEDLPSTAGWLSPDGRWLAHPGSLGQDIVLHEMASGVSRRLTFENQDVNNCVWAPDGRRIAFSRLFGMQGWQVRVKSLDSGQDSSLFQGQGLFNFPLCWSRDGRWLVVERVDSTSTGDLWKVDMNGGGASIYQRTRGDERGGSSEAALSPDGKWLAYITVEDAHRVLYVQSFPEPGNPYQVAVDDPAGVLWRRPNAIGVGTGKGELVSIAVSTEQGFQQGATTRLFTIGRNQSVLDVAPGEQKFLVAQVKDLSSLTSFEVLLDWPALLEGRP